MVKFIGMIDQPYRNLMKNSSWSSLSEYLVNLIGISDQLEWNNQTNNTDHEETLTFNSIYMSEEKKDALPWRNNGQWTL